MNKFLSTIIGLLLAISFHQEVTAQENFKFGKITKEELAMKHYVPDTSATAVYLYVDNETRFTFDPYSGYGTVSDCAYRIKILKPEGKKYADISIPFYVSEGASGTKEQITHIKATSYTLVEGKVRESELSKKYIFEEKGTGYGRVMKFSIPNVEEGSVIEFKYTRHSNNPYLLRPWVIQGTLPIQYGKYNVQIPDFFQYRLEPKGYEPIEIKKENTTQSFNAGANVLGHEMVTCNDYTFTVKDIPAIKNEPFLWCIDDYLTSMEFELEGIRFSNGRYESYTGNWKEIKNTLQELPSFGGMMELKNPFSDETNSIKSEELTFEEKLRAALGMLKQKIKWNGTYSLAGRDIKESIEKGTATNANLNFILMSVLRDLGIPCKPILLRTRQLGRLPFHPTIDKLNTFIVSAYSPDGTPYYLDGSIEYGDLNQLPTLLMVPQAIVFDESPIVQTVDLSNIGHTMTLHNVNVTVHADGSFEGTRQSTYTGQVASYFKQQMANEKDSIETMKKTEERYDISIVQCKTQKTKGLGSRCNEQIHFNGDFATGEDLIYLNAIIFPDKTENPFTNASRKFPIEFPHTQSVSINTTLTIPEGYQVEELPKSSRSTMNQDELAFSYIVRQSGNKVTIQYKSAINTPFIGSEQYKELCSFWEEMTSRNNQQLVLKKIQEKP